MPVLVEFDQQKESEKIKKFTMKIWNARAERVSRTVNFWENEYAIVHLPLGNKHNPRSRSQRKAQELVDLLK